MITSRFAPSPTGRLHLGHAWSALLAHDFARERGGVFLLRIEDIDPGRARAEHVQSIIEDLTWLGLAWDGEVLLQSRRLGAYSDALDRLKAERLVYPCFCTRSAIAAEIAASASAPHPGPGSGPSGTDGPLYPGTCRALPDSERERRMRNEPHAWRLDSARAAETAGPLYWRDDDTEVQIEPDAHGDVVLARKDAPTSYHLAVTVDDSEQCVTDVVRGRDLYAATDVHRLLQALLGLPTPLYHHHSLLVDSGGRRLAKRSGAPILADLRASGADPRALVDDLRAGRLPAGYWIADS
ncbi:MAG: tRNA glutamyl-Q(34) synthetase GluQRS [Allosphingosinicella sp.]